MLSAEQVLDTYFLDARSMLIELAALLDRLDRAEASGGRLPEDEQRVAAIRSALAILADPNSPADRAERLLLLFSELLEQPAAS